jgi:hypothetical protein
MADMVEDFIPIGYDCHGGHGFSSGRTLLSPEESGGEEV